MSDCYIRLPLEKDGVPLNTPFITDWTPYRLSQCLSSSGEGSIAQDDLVKEEDETEKEVIEERKSEPRISYSEKYGVELKELCAKLNCPQKSFQIEKLAVAWESLVKLQQDQLHDRILVEEDTRLEASDDGEEEGVVGSREDSAPLNSETVWHGYFKDYDILDDMAAFSAYQLGNCIEIGHQDTVEMMQEYLRKCWRENLAADIVEGSGARCFIIDLFRGNAHRNQMVIVRFRLSELNVASELGYPITSTLFARLSPRLQYTGYLAGGLEWVNLCKNDIVVVTTDRCWADNCSKNRIFVNARSLLEDVYPNDILLLGIEAQLLVQKPIRENALRCKVIVGGKLRSRMPVVFPGRCSRYHISLSELEDITFAREVGINVIVSDIVGTPSYYENLTGTLKLLDCSHLRLFARLILNDMDAEPTDMSWAVEAYDGFIGASSLFRYGCGGDGNIADPGDKPSTRIFFVSQTIRDLLDAAHAANKPFIFDLSLFISGWYVLDPSCYGTILYHPDKFLLPSHRMLEAENFFLLINALRSGLPERKFAEMLPYCDTSHTGSDSLALATVGASFETDASCIFVVGHTGRMAIKISTFRPKATIFFISHLKSAANYISIYHNTTMLYYKPPGGISEHARVVYMQFLFALSYAWNLKTLHDGDQVLFVYGQNAGQQFPDKYAAYKFDERTFVEDLTHFLF